MLAPKPAFVQFVHSIEHDEDLNGRNRVEHVRIMAGGSTEATIVPQTREDKINRFLTRQSFGVVEEMQSCQAPVDAIES